MTHTVQLQLTLDVEVDAIFVEGAWRLRNIGVISVENATPTGRTIAFDGPLTVRALLEQTKANELAELYAQQEP